MALAQCYRRTSLRTTRPCNSTRIWIFQFTFSFHSQCDAKSKLSLTSSACGQVGRQSALRWPPCEDKLWQPRLKLLTSSSYTIVIVIFIIIIVVGVIIITIIMGLAFNLLWQLRWKLSARTQLVSFDIWERACNDQLAKQESYFTFALIAIREYFLCLHWLQYRKNFPCLHWLQYRNRIARLHWLQYRNHRYLITDLETIRCGLLSWNFWENLDPLIYEEAENGDSDINPSLLSLFNAIFLSLLSLNDYWLSSGLAN